MSAGHRARMHGREKQKTNKYQPNKKKNMSQHEKAYANNLRNKTNGDLANVKSNLVGLLNNEKKKSSPDKSLFDSYKWQLGLINAELNRRNPNKDRMMQAEGNKARPKLTVAEMLKQKTLEELTALLNDAKDRLSDFEEKAKVSRMTDYDAQKAILVGRIASVEAEIKTREPKVEQAVKNEVEQLSGKIMGVDKQFAIAVFTGALAGGLGAWMFRGDKKAQIWQWALVGVVAGAGYNWYNKKTLAKGAVK